MTIIKNNFVDSFDAIIDACLEFYNNDGVNELLTSYDSEKLLQSKDVAKIISITQ